MNIEQPVDLYELACLPPKNWRLRCERYQEALSALENRDMGTAKKLAEQLTIEFPDDTAALALVSRISEAENSEPGFDTSVWCLPGK